MKLKSSLLSLCIAFGLASSPLNAKVSQAEANKLGKSLTPFGSIKNGNRDGTIPAWDGGITEPPAGFKGTGNHHIDPFADDQVKFTIDSSNYQDYADNLSAGQIKFFETYADSFKMNVYPTRRSHSMPEWVYENTKKNARTGELTRGGVGIRNAFGGVPFPIPSGNNEAQALQIMWNHLTRWRGIFLKARFSELAVQRDGRFNPITKRQEVLFNFHNPKSSFKKMDNILFYFLTVTQSPARLAGGALLVHETLDQLKDKRQAWDYNSGQRRVRRAPNLAYDSPIASSDNTRTADDTDMYNGAPDRYNWKYLGLKEIYIPYNSYKFTGPDVSYDDIVVPGHVNPELVRWELHRVHVVEANLKPKERHIYKKRVFYVDADSWGVSMTDKYDNRDELWRQSTSFSKNYYELPGTWSGGVGHFDFQSRRYSVNAIYAQENGAPTFTDKIPNRRYFKPSSLRRLGR